MAAGAVYIRKASLFVNHKELYLPLERQEARLWATSREIVDSETQPESQGIGRYLVQKCEIMGQRKKSGARKGSVSTDSKFA